MKNELKKNFLTKPFKKPPFTNYKINPINITTKKYSKKPQLIINLSSPHNNKQNNINSLINKKKYSLSYIKINNTIKIIQNLKKKTTIYKTNISNTFKLIPILPSQ